MPVPIRDVLYSSKEQVVRVIGESDYDDFPFSGISVALCRTLHRRNEKPHLAERRRQANSALVRKFRLARKKLVKG